MKSFRAAMVLVSLSALMGCTEVSPPEDGDVSQAEGAFITDNALTDNALTDNALTDNALTDNALTDNALTDNALTDNALSAIQDPSAQGDLNRELLRYIVACAFRKNQSFDFTWNDTNNVSHNEHYVGQLGLAPQWRTGRLNERGQRMVTACLGAKVNYYGIRVTISVRSGENPLRLHPFDDEIDQFPYVEGAFWGNLWASTPYINTCYDPLNVSHSHSKLRDCASGHPLGNGGVEECGIIDVAGPCNSVCSKFNSGSQYYEHCLEHPGSSNKRTDYVITTALP